MKKTAIIIDSTAYMSEADFNKGNYYMVPLSVNFDNVSFTEEPTDSSQNEEVFKRINAVKSLPQTSQPSPQKAFDTFDRAVADGYERLVGLHLSAELSGTSQGMRNAANQYMEEHPEIEIEIYDSKAAAQVTGVIVRTAETVLQTTGSLEAEMIERIIEHYSTKTRAFVFVDNLDYLAYGGRIPAAMASIGNLFGITPIITLNDRGGLEKYKSERSAKKAIMSTLKELADADFDQNDEIILHGFYTTEDKMAVKLLKEANKVTNANVVESSTSQMGIVISNHLGPKAYGIFWTPKFKG